MNADREQPSNKVSLFNSCRSYQRIVATTTIIAFGLVACTGTGEPGGGIVPGANSARGGPAALQGASRRFEAYRTTSDSIKSFVRRDIAGGGYSLTSKTDPNKKIVVSRELNGTVSFRTSTGVSGSIITRPDGSTWIQASDQEGHSLLHQITTQNTRLIGGNFSAQYVEACNPAEEAQLMDDQDNVNNAQIQYGGAVALFILDFGWNAFSILISGGAMALPDWIAYAGVSEAVLAADNNLNTAEGILNRDQSTFHCV
ncbi:MAG: hypothetical protein ACP5O6_09960 [Candidatus Baltobacteraceae bacterium]